ncbi:hypothetical protein HMPREF1624_01318 [Sporothrix schenckii ATCC 58251]|uniref:Thioredoxin domain-containing protein n=1 Tax=Sporothrix schenckii (strain ATCC 58251 / de Perez 2211183) TaxID=1391915 RepID=U7Q560_SPOS1|nr:hypothetical protein HMPREF1624_01318 [Sporothrix schenckii ATCC 58251]
MATTDAPAPACALPGEDNVNQREFSGTVRTDNNVPSRGTLKKTADLPVLDREGKSYPFKSLYEDFTGQTLVVFVRHFFCGNCQEYLRLLSQAIPLATLSKAPTPSQIVVVGCGDPSLIDMYVEVAECVFPVYADPTRRLYDEFGMVSTLSLGPPPAYMKHTNIWASSFRSIAQGLRQLPRGLALKSGNHRQVGGEFLFRKSTADDAVSVTWCHRMKHTRDHAETDELQAVLGLETTAAESKSEKELATPVPAATTATKQMAAA